MVDRRYVERPVDWDAVNDFSALAASEQERVLVEARAYAAFYGADPGAHPAAVAGPFFALAVASMAILVTLVGAAASHPGPKVVYGWLVIAFAVCLFGLVFGAYRLWTVAGAAVDRRMCAASWVAAFESVIEAQRAGRWGADPAVIGGATSVFPAVMARKRFRLRPPGR